MPTAKSFRDLLASFAPPRDNKATRRPAVVGLKPGDTYGHLQIISRNGVSGNPLEWLCACRCGATIRVSGTISARLPTSVSYAGGRPTIIIDNELLSFEQLISTRKVLHDQQATSQMPLLPI
jgi:hypothetical protein